MTFECGLEVFQQSWPHGQADVVQRLRLLLVMVVSLVTGSGAFCKIPELPPPSFRAVWCSFHYVLVSHGRCCVIWVQYLNVSTSLSIST